MQPRMTRMIALLACLAIALPALAQFGYPLKGSWSGEWWLKKGDENRILLQFDWDGKTVSGVYNPGTDNVKLTNLRLDPPGGGVKNAMAGWPLHFEVDTKDASGKPVRYVVDGKLENIGAYNKIVTGTWTVGNQKGQFRIVMN
jgi:hypothetical protein